MSRSSPFPIPNGSQEDSLRCMCFHQGALPGTDPMQSMHSARFILQPCTTGRRRRRLESSNNPATTPEAKDAHKTHTQWPRLRFMSHFNVTAAIPQRPPRGSPAPSLPAWVALIDEEQTAEHSTANNLAKSSALDVSPATYGLRNGCTSDTILHAIAGISPEELTQWTVGERHLLGHFLQSVARALSVVDDESNPFMNTIAPMSTTRPEVRHALLALSAAHISKTYPEFVTDLLDHRSRAMLGLKAILPTTTSTVYALATVLLLCLADLCEGGSRKWLLHLHGARALLETSTATSERPMQFLIVLYNYLCCVTRVTQPNSPAPLSSSLVSHYMDPIYGLSMELYDYLERINGLAIAKAHNEAANMASLEAKAITMDESLRTWSPPVPPSSPEHATAAKAAATAMRWAVRIRLHQTVPGLSSPDYDDQTAVHQILSALSLVRIGSDEEARLLLPLFMAGLAAGTKADRLTIEYRINNLELVRGFANISVVHRLLQDYWHRANCGQETSWEELMRDGCPGLVLA
ncbi:Uu.00g032850.m01.CDS01 [Anthostomella pinea]|uniref:Uu.00g032850.m01.CDS01 n=1 Tax=Anthostomella pinea TaxID=933095 RepID=A0AAI8YD78_9PEZI|nr:Uu.00g032850.m01.CDS01 [Anthostomella pinea]